MGFVDMINKFIGLFSFNSILIEIIAITILLGAIGWFSWRWWSRKQLFKYNFVIINQYGHMTLTKARVIKNERGIRRFMVKEYPNPEHHLSLEQEPTLYINKVAYRMVAPDGRGGLAYLKKLTISKEEYLETALKTQLKSEMADAVIEAKTKHSTMNTAMKWMITSVIILCVFLFLMVYFVSKSGVEITKLQQGNSATFLEASNTQSSMMDAINRNTFVTERILSQTCGGNYSLELEAK